MTDGKPEIDPPIISNEGTLPSNDIVDKGTLPSNDIVDKGTLPSNEGTEDVVIIKRKKGRPRKEVVENVPTVPEEKKKRGRKKKEVVVEEIKKKKKRGRKAAVKYFSSSIRKKIPLTTVLQDKNNYILHLDVKDEDVIEEKISSIDNVNQQSTLPSNDIIGKGTLPSIDIIGKGTLPSNDTDDKGEFDGHQGILPITDDINKLEIADLVFEKLKSENKENIMELQKEYDDLLKQEERILNEINDETLTDLYEKRIEFREHQDTILVNKLETIHKENDICNKMNSMTFSDEKDKVEYSETNERETNKKRGFFEIMHEFIHSDNWLDKTDICCWWCCHQFETVPIGLPVKYDEKKKFHVKGVFCSFSCMMAYKNDNPIYQSKRDLINFLYKKLTGAFLLDINLVPAPPRCALKMFGGELNINQFRNSFKENKIYKMIQYPMFICNDYIEEVDIENIKRVNQNVFSDIPTNKTLNLDEKRIEDAKNRLSQIEKTTITLGNTIDKFIKIT
jgi:hypothetical protein